MSKRLNNSLFVLGWVLLFIPLVVNLWGYLSGNGPLLETWGRVVGVYVWNIPCAVVGLLLVIPLDWKR